MPTHPPQQSFAIACRISLAALTLCSAMGAQAAEAGYRVAEKVVLDGPVRWDYLSLDSARHHLFLTRGDHVDVFDTESKRVTGTIAGTAGVHGVAVASDRDRGFTSNGGSDSVTVFALSTLKEIATIPVGAKPDSIVYDPKTGRVFAANGKSRDLSVIDAAGNKLVGTIALDGGPETAVVDGKGRLFVALEDRNAIAVIDTGSMKVTRQIDVAAVCDEPAGLAIDAATDRLFAGCHNQKMAIVDGITGQILAAAAIGKGNDATAYDPARKLAFASNGDGTLTVVGGEAPWPVSQVLPTMARARTLALDPGSHAIYLVSAEVDQATQPPVQGARARPALKPGTFTVLKVEGR